MHSSPNNVISLSTGKPVETDDPTLKIPELDEVDLQLWSALTLGALQKQLVGQENEPGFAVAKAVVDNLATQFATTDTIDIANYFEAISRVSALSSDSAMRLDELEFFDPQAA